MSDSRRRRSRLQTESIALFLKLKAQADNVLDVDGTDENVLQKFPLKSLDLDKMMTHMLDCASALCRVYQMQKEDSTSANDDSGEARNISNRLERASHRKLFSFALQESLVYYFDHDGPPLSSTPALEHLLNAFPVILEERENDNWLPLHWAAVASTTASGGAVAETGRTETKLLYTEDSSSLGEHHVPSSDRMRFFAETVPGYTPLHMLCMVPKPDMELLKYFAGANPAAFTIRANSVMSEHTNGGSYPLHIAARYCDSVEALQLLVQTSPELLDKKEGRWSYPLDVLISNYSDERTSFPDMLKCLLTANDTVPVIGEAVRALINLLSRERNLSTTSREYVFSLIVEMLAKYPLLAAEYRSQSVLYNTPGSTLLHHAAGTQFADDEHCMRMLQFLVDAAPEHVTTTGVFGYIDHGLPVHAAAGGGNFVALKFLLDLRPETWMTRSEGGQMNLLHCAVNAMYTRVCKDHQVGIHKIKYILEHHNEFQYEWHLNGETPLLVLIIASALDAIPFLLDPVAVKLPHKMRREPQPTSTSTSPSPNMTLPLHYLLEYCSVNDSRYMGIFRKLLCLYPEAAGVQNERGQTPYDIAKRKKYSADVLRLLLRASPDQDPQALRDLNWEARKMAVWLGSYRAIAIGETLNIMARLRMVDNKDNDLIRYIVSFL